MNPYPCRFCGAAGFHLCAEAAKADAARHKAMVQSETFTSDEWGVIDIAVGRLITFLSARATEVTAKGKLDDAESYLREVRIAQQAREVVRKIREAWPQSMNPTPKPEIYINGVRQDPAAGPVVWEKAAKAPRIDLSNLPATCISSFAPTFVARAADAVCGPPVCDDRLMFTWDMLDSTPIDQRPPRKPQHMFLEHGGMAELASDSSPDFTLLQLTRKLDASGATVGPGWNRAELDAWFLSFRDAWRIANVKHCGELTGQVNDAGYWLMLWRNGWSGQSSA